jgi:hypothetical protein
MIIPWHYAVQEMFSIFTNPDSGSKQGENMPDDEDLDFESEESARQWLDHLNYCINNPAEEGFNGQQVKQMQEEAGKVAGWINRRHSN